MSTITGFDDKTNGWNKAIVQKMGGVDIADAFLRGEYVLTKLDQTFMNFLKFDGRVVVEIIDPCDFKKFFRSRRGLWVIYNFQRLFVTNNAVSTVKEFSISKYSVIQDTSESEIRKKLPSDHIFEAEDFLPLLSAMLSKQWIVKSGSLLRDGNQNIFYVRSKNKKGVLTVSVHWDLDSEVQEWRVNVWYPGALRLPIGSAVFTRN